MADIFDYFDWRGDLSFDVSPENEVDNFILSMIGCPDFTGIIPENENSISLVSAVKKYFDKNPYYGKPLGALSSINILQALLRLPATIRFKDLALSGFVKKLIVWIQNNFLRLRLSFLIENILFLSEAQMILLWDGKKIL